MMVMTSKTTIATTRRTNVQYTYTQVMFKPVLTVRSQISHFFSRIPTKSLITVLYPPKSSLRVWTPFGKTTQYYVAYHIFIGPAGTWV